MTEAEGMTQLVRRDLADIARRPHAAPLPSIGEGELGTQRAPERRTVEDLRFGRDAAKAAEGQRPAAVRRRANVVLRIVEAHDVRARTRRRHLIGQTTVA